MHNIENLLSTPMAELNDTHFVQQTMTKIIERQKSFQKLKQKVMLIACGLCVLIASLLSFDFSINFGLPQQINDLSSLAMGSTTLGFLIIATILVISFLAYESFEQ